MSPRRQRAPVDKAAQLDAIYAKLPEVDCLGKCWDSCGPIRMTGTERRRIVDAGGPNIPDGSALDGALICPALTLLKRCQTHEVRPLICRAFGAVKAMPCGFGCEVKGEPLDDAEFYELLAQTLEVDGLHADAARVREPWSTPERAADSAQLLRRLRADRDLDYAVRERRAVANGSARYVHGRGQFGREPLGGFQ